MLKYHLKQQTPMIHFQHYEDGACLRASEVKPKLDRFIVKQMGGEKSIDDKWWANPKKDKKGDIMQPSFNYKMRFEAEGTPEISTNICKSYFGNLAHEIKNYKKTVFYPKGVNMTIVCFHKTLLEKINELLPLFFLTHNFGTRQSKGFGSFLLSNENGKVCYEPENILTEYLRRNGKSAYYFDVNKYSTNPKTTNPYSHAMDAIDMFYKVLKNGFNNGSNKYKPSYLMKKYFKGVINDKRIMKQALVNTDLFMLTTTSGKGIAYYDDGKKTLLVKDTVELKGFYIRGLLGYAQEYTFRDVISKDTRKKLNVKFTVDGDDVKRFASPILFKPLRIDKNNSARVYLIPNRDMFAKLDGKSVILICKADRGATAIETNALDNIKLNLPLKYNPDFLDDFFEKASEDCANGYTFNRYKLVRR